MSTLVTDPPRSPPRIVRALLAADWAVCGAAVAAGGWVAGLVLARSLLGLQFAARDFPTGRFVEFTIALAGIGGGWGLLAGHVAGLTRRGAHRLGDRIAAGAIGAVGWAVVGLIGGGLVPVSVAVVGRALPVEVSTSLGWAVAGMLAGLVVYGWTQVREKSPPVADEGPDEFVEPGPPPVGEGWPRSLLVAGKWATGGAVAAAGAWTFGLLVGQYALGISILARPTKSKVEQAALAAAEYGAACGIVVGLAVGLLAARRAGGYVSRGATGAVGGAVVGLIGGGLAPLLAVELRWWVPVEIGSALGWAYVGALAGLVAYGWARTRTVSETAPDEFEPSQARWGSILVAGVWAACGAVAAVGAWVVGLAAVRYGPGLAPLALAIRQQPAETAAYLAAFGGGWGLLIGVLAGLRSGRVVAGAVGGALVGLIGGGLAPLTVTAAGRGVSLEVGSSPGWALAGLMAGLAAYGWTRPKAERVATPGGGRTLRLAPILGLATLAVAAAFAAVTGVLPDHGRWAAGAVALLAVAVLAIVVAAVVAAQDRRIRELERRVRELEWDDGT
jgi:hypothetical protein